MASRWLVVARVLPNCFALVTTFLYTLFRASRNNIHIRRLFQTGQIAMVMQLFVRAVCGGIINYADGLRDLYLESIVLRNRHLPPPNTYTSPPINRTINSMSESDCLLWTRFTKPQLRKLFVHLRIPEGRINVLSFRPNNFRWFTGEEILIISLTKLATGEAWFRMTSKFGGNPDFFCYALAWFVDHVFDLLYNKISGKSMELLWVDKIDTFRSLFHEKVKTSPCQIERYLDGSLTETYIIYTPFETWRTFGIIDDTTLKTSRPSAGPETDEQHAPRRINGHLIQKAFYSGYLKRHGLKFQTLLLPNGLFGSVWGSSMSHNNIGILNMSGLVDHLQTILHWILGTDLYPTMLGDSIFVPNPVLTRRVGAPEGTLQDIIDRRMKSMRQPVELCYGIFFNLFQLFKISTQFKLFKSAEKSYGTMMVSYILFNCYTCFNGNVATCFFDSQPPSIKEYLPIDENIEPYQPYAFNKNYNYI